MNIYPSCTFDLVSEANWHIPQHAARDCGREKFVPRLPVINVHCKCSHTVRTSCSLMLGSGLNTVTEIRVMYLLNCSSSATNPLLYIVIL
jgi:hypothetical protein